MNHFFIMKTSSKISSGFTLIELMIVIAIIAIIAAIAIPNMIRARMAANEANAIGGLRTISTGEIQYRAAMEGPLVGGVAPFGTLSALGSTAPPFLDALLGQNNAIKSGYQYNVVVVAPAPANPPAFGATAGRLGPRSGSRSFFVDESGVVTGVIGNGPATATDDPIS
ncbi:MAG: prepilin-type N-terminal cleavage/methylation domain-containing protein [Candidatus Hydrogenedentota bacterium]